MAFLASKWQLIKGLVFCILALNCAILKANLIISNGSSLNIGDSSILVTGNIGVEPTAVLAGSAGTLEFSGNWNVAGTFIPGSSTVRLIGTNQAIHFATTFHNFEKSSTSPATLSFPAGSTVNFTGKIDVRGTNTDPLNITSDNPPQLWHSEQAIPNVVFSQVNMEHSDTYLGASRTLIGGNQFSSYRMVCLGNDTNIDTIASVLLNTLGPYDTRYWRAFRWDGVDYQEGNQMTGLNVLGSNSAKAIWLISRYNADFHFPTPVDHTVDATIVLQPGFNMIGNPFAMPRTASDVSVSTDGGTTWLAINSSAPPQTAVAQTIFRYNASGAYEQASIIQKYEGVWMNNTTDSPVALRIKAPGSP